MRSSKPRVQPLGDDEFTPDARAIALRFLSKERSENNLIRSFARSPAALEAFLTWADYIFSHSSLPDREREIVTVRTAHLAQSPYEMAQHVVLSHAAGVTPDEFARIKAGADAGWGAADAALIRACDDLFADYCVSDTVWQSLLSNFSLREAMDVVMTVGQYLQLAMMLNSFGVQVEPGLQSQVDKMGYS